MRKGSISRCGRRSAAPTSAGRYSICSAVQDDALRIAVKKSPGGVFSTLANEGLKAGDVVEVMPPLGHFNVPLMPRRGATTWALPPAAASR